MTVPSEPGELAAIETSINEWLDVQQRDNPVVLGVAADADGPRSWFVRMKGDEKDVFTIRFHLRQRTLHYETHFMPAPEENEAQLFEHLLRRNAKLFGATFAVGEEDAVYLRGQLENSLLANSLLVDDELDRVLGSMYVWVEQYFRPALRIGFASRFDD